MRLTWRWVGGVALVAMLAPSVAWAGDDKDEKVVAREEYSTVIEGLDEALLERAVAELAAHHPGVRGRVKNGVLKLHGEDAAAWKRAMHALRELGVPVAPPPADGPREVVLVTSTDAPGALRFVLDGKEHRGPPADKAIERHIGTLEEKLVAARAVGSANQAEELEKELNHLRALRRELAAHRAARPDPATPKQGGGPDAQRQAMRAGAEVLEKKLIEAREAGREREVAELEQSLAQLRYLHQASERRAGARRGDEPADLGALRERLEAAKRALAEAMPEERRRMPHVGMEQAEVLELQRLFEDRAEAMGGDLGRKRSSRGPNGPPKDQALQERIEHTRKALKHLREAGLPEHAQRVEQALHRMEMAAQGPNEGSEAARVFIKRTGPHKDGFATEGGMEPQPGSGRMGSSPGMSSPGMRGPMPAPMPALVPTPQADCAPPSVGGFRRGPIYPLPPAAPQAQPASPRAGEVRLVGPMGQPVRNAIVRRGPDRGDTQAGPGAQGDGATRNPAPPHARGPGRPPQGEMQPVLAELRAQMAELRQQMKRLSRQVAEQADEQDDDDDAHAKPAAPQEHQGRR